MAAEAPAASNQAREALSRIERMRASKAIERFTPRRTSSLLPQGYRDAEFNAAPIRPSVPFKILVRVLSRNSIASIDAGVICLQTRVLWINAIRRV